MTPCTRSLLFREAAMPKRRPGETVTEDTTSIPCHYVSINSDLAVSTTTSNRWSNYLNVCTPLRHHFWSCLINNRNDIKIGGCGLRSPWLCCFQSAPRVFTAEMWCAQLMTEYITLTTGNCLLYLISFYLDIFPN